jgi:hypothetical protein
MGRWKNDGDGVRIKKREKFYNGRLGGQSEILYSWIIGEGILRRLYDIQNTTTFTLRIFCVGRKSQAYPKNVEEQCIDELKVALSWIPNAVVKGESTFPIHNKVKRQLLSTYTASTVRNVIDGFK